MNAENKTVHGREFVSIRRAAWVLGVDQPVVCRAIRRGALPMVRRRGRVGVPASALARLLCPAGDEHAAEHGTDNNDTTTHVATGDNGHADGRDDGGRDDGGGGASGRPGGGA